MQSRSDRYNNDRENWRFWTNSAIFFPVHISPVMTKHAIIFPSKVDNLNCVICRNIISFGLTRTDTFEDYTYIFGIPGGGGPGTFLMEHMPKSTQRVATFLSQKKKEGYPKQYLKSTMVLF